LCSAWNTSMKLKVPEISNLLFGVGELDIVGLIVQTLTDSLDLLWTHSLGSEELRNQ